MKLLGRRDAANVQKVLWCLSELGLAAEQENYGGSYGRTAEAAYLAVNPTGKVPTLIDAGVSIWESNTILRYLCNAYDAGSWYPQDPVRRTSTERWMDWQLAALWPGFMPLFIGLRRERRPLSAVQTLLVQAQAQMALLDRELARHEYLAGIEPTLAEIAVGLFVHRWFELDIPREPLPHLEAWYQRLTTRAGFRRHVMGLEEE